MKLILTIILILLSTVDCYKLKLLKLEKCNPDVEYTIDIDVKLREEDDQQYIDTSMLKTPIPLGRNIDLYVDISVLENGNFKHFITIKRDFCTAIYKYTAEMAYELQDLTGIERGACPIPSGEYGVENYLLDFNKVKPKEEIIDEGQLKAVVNFFDAATNESLACLDVLILKIKDE